MTYGNNGRLSRTLGLLIMADGAMADFGRDRAGGSVELGETLQQAAEREILEETGITINAGEPVFTFDVIERDALDRIRFHYVIVDLVAEYVEGVPRAGDDACQARWVSAQEAAQMDLNAATRRLLHERFDFVRL